MKHPIDKRGYFRMDALKEVCLVIKEKVATKNPLEKVLTNQLELLTRRRRYKSV